ncbi:MAG: TetR/AcrR family transcriptional regulator [Capnocytophaga sp.]|uniref:TetR/AcrR family transcriptional regulator n=1 Tax=unclassified Capnocytophaga TaxID=2640652 RepID=UPI000202F7ED|nr:MULTISPECIES: TetR/AcrR family transcriptional regulator [unclassified Capnocytophaga]EGD35309.1 TetR family transcriptional regulator [Capnocytophaga sp. oral taxon 338 str. F0234]MDU6659795.1 TetR/AcrR family transcriptional regulator [Capnocytophaga sp.]QLF49520.1 TetR/AcrR family transcriptional regulator [Capnocytophaga sp. oral taxon 902]
MKKTKDISTEERIKAAARKVFHQKGFAGTRTRDIAEEAGINHAMLNYYFRSKEKLFEMVMMETMAQFFKGVNLMLNDESTSLDEKIDLIVSNYVDLLLKEPELPTFILNEVRPNPQAFVEQNPIKEALTHSVLTRQYAEAVARGEITEPNLMQAILNVIGLVIFPFIAKPILTSIVNIPEEQYKALMLQRKTLIPQWIKAILWK